MKDQFCKYYFLKTLVFTAAVMLSTASAAASLNPIAHWKFDEGSGITGIDSSGNGNNATLVNGATWTAGKFGGAVNLDGVDDFISAPDSASLDIGDSFTYALWLKRGRVSHFNYEVLFSKGFHTAVSVINADNTLMLCAHSLRCPVTSTAKIIGTSIYHHLVFSRNGSTLAIYLDGVQVASVDNPVVFESSKYEQAIGANHLNDLLSTYSSFFKGAVDDVRIYDRALSLSEVQQLFQQVAPALGGVLLLGDSFTYGYVSSGSPNNDDGGFRRFLWEDLVAANLSDNTNFVGKSQTGVRRMDRDHEGHNGWRTDQLLPLVAPDMNNYNPNVVMLQAGANDMIQGATVTTAINGVAKLVDAIFAAKPNVRIVLFNYVGPVTNTNYPGWNSTSTAKLRDGMKSIASQLAAAGKSIRFVDMAVANLSTAPGSLDFGSDGVHPSSQGYKKIADVLFQELTK